MIEKANKLCITKVSRVFVGIYSYTAPVGKGCRRAEAQCLRRLGNLSHEEKSFEIPIAVRGAAGNGIRSGGPRADGYADDRSSQPFGPLVRGGRNGLL